TPRLNIAGFSISATRGQEPFERFSRYGGGRPNAARALAARGRFGSEYANPNSPLQIAWTKPFGPGNSVMRKRVWKIPGFVGALLVVVVFARGLGIRGQVAGSLPQLDGQLAAPGLNETVVVERDALGIPTIRAANRLDLAEATGFVHAQDRFFQMDLLRRNSAGELAELAGAALVAADRKVRVHRFRDVAQRMLAEAGDAQRSLVEAYTRGVNAGLASLSVKPFEYLLLGQEPSPWKPEDCALVMFSMYLDLQGEDYGDEARLGLMHDLLPAGMFDFV